MISLAMCVNNQKANEVVLDMYGELEGDTYGIRITPEFREYLVLSGIKMKAQRNVSTVEMLQGGRKYLVDRPYKSTYINLQSAVHVYGDKFGKTFNPNGVNLDTIVSNTEILHINDSHVGMDAYDGIWREVYGEIIGDINGVERNDGLISLLNQRGIEEVTGDDGYYLVQGGVPYWIGVQDDYYDFRTLECVESYNVVLEELTIDQLNTVMGYIKNEDIKYKMEGAS